MIETISITYEENKGLRFSSTNWGYKESTEMQKDLISYLKYHKKRITKTAVYVCDKCVAYCDITLYADHKGFDYKISNIRRKEYFADDLKAVNELKTVVEKKEYLKEVGSDINNAVKNGFLTEKWV